MKQTPQIHPEKLSSHEDIVHSDYEFFGPSPDVPNDTLEEVLTRYAYHTKRLIEEITGYGDPDEQYDAVIFLDKSARNFGYLARAFWQDLAYRDWPYQAEKATADTGKMEIEPPFMFLNIDKNQWVRSEHIVLDPNQPGQERWDREHEASDIAIAGLRKMFLKERHELATKDDLTIDDIQQIYGLETVFSGLTEGRKPRILIVDEIESTGTTMELARKFLEQAIPEAEFGTHYAMRGNKGSSRNGVFAYELPLWYSPADSAKKFGSVEDVRGEKGIGPRDAEYWRREYLANPDHNWREYAGRTFMSTPLQKEMHLRQSKSVQHDIKQMVVDYRRGALRIPEKVFDFYGDRRVKKSGLYQGTK